MKRILFISMALVMTTGCSAGEPNSNSAPEMPEIVQLLQCDSIPERNIILANVPYRLLSEEDRVSA